MTILQSNTGEIVENSSIWIAPHPTVLHDDEKEEEMDGHDVDVSDTLPLTVLPESRPRCEFGTYSIGLMLAFISGLVFSVNSYLVQALSLDYAETMIVRSLVQVIVIGILLHNRSLSLWPTVERHPTRTKLLMVFQGVLGSVMVLCSISCLQFLPLGDALTLIFSAPVSTMILAAIFLKQRLRLYKATFGCLLLCGTVLVVRPPFLFPQDGNKDDDLGTLFGSNDTMLISMYADLLHATKNSAMSAQFHNPLYYIGVAIALSSAIADGFLNVAINLCQQVPPLVLLWWTGLGGIFVSLISFTFDEKARILSPDIVDISYQDWLAYILMALAGIGAYFCMTKSLQTIDPTVVAFVRALEIVFAYIIQIGIMQQMPALLSIVGASLVLLSVFAMAMHDKVVALMPRGIKFIF